MSEEINIQNTVIDKQEINSSGTNQNIGPKNTDIEDTNNDGIQTEKDENSIDKKDNKITTDNTSNYSDAVTKEQKINEILALKDTLDSLIGNIRHTKQMCYKYENENQYLQDYVGSLMKSGDMK